MRNYHQSGACKAKTALDKRIEAVQGKQVKDAGTAAILYITPGETAIWTYGTASMANVIMKESGLTNVYADRPERVFEVSAEDVLAKDPDYVVLVNIGFGKDETIDALKGLGSLGTLKALKEDKVTVMPYAWTDPASSLVVDGIETVRFAAAPSVGLVGRPLGLPVERGDEAGRHQGLVLHP